MGATGPGYVPMVGMASPSYMLMNVCPRLCSVQGYFSDAWNTFLTPSVVIGSIVDVALSEADVSMCLPSASRPVSVRYQTHPTLHCITWTSHRARSHLIQNREFARESVEKRP